MRFTFIINPAAGRGRSRRLWPRLERRLVARGVDFHSFHTKGPGHAEELARAHAGDGAVVAVGGDGTGNEVAAGLLGKPNPFGLLPAGTGNDYCRSIGMGTDADVALERLLAASPRWVDVGLVNGRPFINVAGIGLDAEVAAEVNRLPKYFGGTVPYVYALLKILSRFRPVPMRCVADGRTLEGKVLLIAVAIAACYGGGMRIAPNARIDDGYFDVVIAGDLSRLDTLGALPRLYTGSHLGLPKITWFRARDVAVESAVPVAFHADGEPLGRLPARFACQPRALSVLASG